MGIIETRDQAHAAPVDDVVRIVDFFAGVRWPIPQDDVSAFVLRLGWTVEPLLLENHLVANTGWPLNRPEVDLECDNGELTTVGLRVTDVVREELPWRADFMNDSFSEFAGAIASVLGRPSRVRKRSGQGAQWELPNGGRLNVDQIESSVSVSVISKEWADVNRRMGE